MDCNQNIDTPEELINAYLFRLPRAYKYAGYVWPGVMLSPERLQLVANLKFNKSDVIIASYPKSGTTWVSEIVSLIINGGSEEAVMSRPLHERVLWLEMDNDFMWVKFFWLWQVISKMLRIAPASQNDTTSTGERRVFFTHLPLELLPQYIFTSGCKVIYVSRNPKDNAVSFYHFHQMARFLGQQKTTWSEFLSLYVGGHVYCGSWFEHVLSYWELSKGNPLVMFLKYEDLKKDLKKEVLKISGFLGQDLSEKALSNVTKRCQFESMKSNHMVNRDGVWLFNQKVSSFMRKGTIGDWKNYFTVTESEFFDKLYKDKMKGTGLSYVFDVDF